MSFKKRFVSEKSIKYYLDNNLSFNELFKADAMICLDSVSSKVFELYSRINDTEKLKTEILKLYGQ
jgi:hypothetical protein